MRAASGRCAEFDNEQERKGWTSLACGCTIVMSSRSVRIAEEGLPMTSFVHRCAVISTILLLALSACAPLPTAQPTPTPEIPQDKASCEALGGRWGRIGLGPREQCNLPAVDAGMTCSDSDECEGMCLADLDEEEMDRVSRQGKELRTTGQCAAWRIVVGCLAVVEDGSVSSILCID
jgi:hypothetical protein